MLKKCILNGKVHMAKMAKGKMLQAGIFSDLHHDVYSTKSILKI
jgi:hypothetical protein